MFTTIVDSQTLARHLGHTDWLVLDCRFNLSDTGYGERAYAEGHIPGAYYLHLDDDLSSPITLESGRHPLPDVARLVAKLVKVGMNDSTQVVVYDDCGGAMAGRAWWLLRWMGHAAVALLDGGFPVWVRQQGGLQSDTPVTGGPGDFQPRMQHHFIVDTEQLLDNTDWQLVDARSTERFLGEAEPIDPIAGRIPGAINRPLTENLDKGCFKSVEQLREEWFQVLDGTVPEKVVHMCGSGVTACHNQLAMEIAGIGGTQLYPGSWSEWIRDPRRPIARG